MINIYIHFPLKYRHCSPTQWQHKMSSCSHLLRSDQKIPDSFDKATPSLRAELLSFKITFCEVHELWEQLEMEIKVVPQRCSGWVWDVQQENAGQNKSFREVSHFWRTFQWLLARVGRTEASSFPKEIKLVLRQRHFTCFTEADLTGDEWR